MKALVNKLLLFSAGIFLCILCVSWRTNDKDAFGEFLKSYDFPVTFNGTGVARENFEKLLKTRFFKEPVKKKKIGYPTIYWSVSQTGTPYRDANIYIELDGIQKVFTFWTESGEFGTCDDTRNINAPGAGIKPVKSCIDECGLLKVETPIYETWVASGYMHLEIYSWDGYYYTPVLIKTPKYYDSGNTPDYTTSFSETIYVCYGYDYYVYAWSDAS